MKRRHKRWGASRDPRETLDGAYMMVRRSNVK
jgi:hypothetical protein